MQAQSAQEKNRQVNQNGPRQDGGLVEPSFRQGVVVRKIVVVQGEIGNRPIDHTCDSDEQFERDVLLQIFPTRGQWFLKQVHEVDYTRGACLKPN